MKILLGCLSFQGLTGSELYVYELARELKCRYGHDVTIASARIGGVMQREAEALGVKLEMITMRLQENHYDVIHLNQNQVAFSLCGLFPETPKVMTTHSEIIAAEKPFLHPSIRRYISIREGVTERLISHNIAAEKIVDIRNPIDFDKYNTLGCRDDGNILWVGRIDYLREHAIVHAAKVAQEMDQQLVIVGDFDNSIFLERVFALQPNTKIYPPNINVRHWVKSCHVTAGIQIGRTTVEGWLCGKSGWVYEVDDMGMIMEMNLEAPPDEKELEKYNSEVVCNQIIETYLSIM